MAARSDSLTEESEINEEIEVLKHIYIDELDVILDDSCRVKTIKVLLHPSTCEDTSVQYVCLTLVFDIPSTYPYDIPAISIRNPRGLAEDDVKSLHDDIVKLAEDRIGTPMLFEIIELTKEGLTEGNMPRCECVICLEHFHDGDVFTKTVCYHYFHGHCLARYVHHSLAKSKKLKEDNERNQNTEKITNEVVCPVCRTSINYNLEELFEAPPPIEDNPTFEISESITQAQKKMKELFNKQWENGGIINLEEEKTKFHITENTVFNLPETEELEEDDPKNLEDFVDGVKYNSTKESPGKKADSEKRSSSSKKGFTRDNRYYDAREQRYYRDQEIWRKDVNEPFDNRRDSDRVYGDKERTSYRDRYYNHESGNKEDRIERTRYKGKYYGRVSGNKGDLKERTSYKDRYYGWESENRGADKERKSYKDKYYCRESGNKEDNNERTSYKDRCYDWESENRGDDEERISYKDRYYSRESGNKEDHSERTSYKDRHTGWESGNKEDYKEKSGYKDRYYNKNDGSTSIITRDRFCPEKESAEVHHRPSSGRGTGRSSRESNSKGRGNDSNRRECEKIVNAECGEIASDKVQNLSNKMSNNKTKTNDTNDITHPRYFNKRADENDRKKSKREACHGRGRGRGNGRGRGQSSKSDKTDRTANSGQNSDNPGKKAQCDNKSEVSGQKSDSKLEPNLSDARNCKVPPGFQPKDFKAVQPPPGFQPKQS